MKRLHHLDVLRGVAILGILPVNVLFFAQPQLEAWAPGSTGGTVTVTDALAANAVTAFALQKFITLFALLFGMGMMILRLRAEERGEAYAPVMLRRLFVLWGLGVVHATLFWYGDVVSIYAPLGLVLCWAGAWRPRTLLWTGAALIAAPLLCCGGLGALAHLAGEGDAASAARQLDPAAPLGRFARDCLVAAVDGDHPAFETAVFRDGSFGRITVLRTVVWLESLVVEVGAFYGWRLAGLFLVGMAWMKDGWFADPVGRRPAFRRLFWWGLVLGAPLQVGALFVPVGGDSPFADIAARQVLLYASSLGLAGTYAAAVALLTARWGVGGVLAPFAAVGRTAFSNYVLQSVLCCFLFYSYGFALFGRLGVATLMGVTAAIWGVQLLTSRLWMRQFAYGPLEWAWRSVTYRRRLSFRREPG
jgi:uncharacterized protein